MSEIDALRAALKEREETVKALIDVIAEIAKAIEALRTA